MTDPVIRNAMREDFREIVRLIGDLASHVDSRVTPRTTVEILDHEGPFGKRRFKILVADRGNQIIGFCLYTYAFSGWRGATGLFIEDLYVDEGARGLGLGKKLLAATAKAERGNASFIKLEVKLSDSAAVKFYESLGMTLFEGEGIMLMNDTGMQTLVGS